ncbi:MAG: hypothetical protein ACRDK9_13670 [Solirubrobacterales bacterium]
MATRRLTVPAAPAGVSPRDGMAEAARLWWREGASELTLRRDGWWWTAWTAGVVCFFAAPGIALIWIEPLTFPAAAICFAHAFGVPWLQARRGARQVVAIGRERSSGRRGDADRPAERVALGLLGDLVAHEQRELLAATGLMVEAGELGVWALGENGAFLVRAGGRRVDCWCVRISDDSELPGGDRVAHLLLALREDERGFATVANLGFSGAVWRVRRCLEERSRPALDAARRLARA